MKTQKKKTQQLLKKFTSLAAAAIAAHGVASGQVVLSIPDTTLKVRFFDQGYEIDSMNIDLNNDSIPDFRVFIAVSRSSFSSTTSQYYSTVHYSNVYGYYFIKPVNQQNGWIPLSANVNYVQPLESNFKILKSLQFRNSGYSANLYGFMRLYKNGELSSSVLLGYFGRQYNFIGVKFYDTTGAAHVGWIKIRINGDTSLTVQKFAYEQSADSIFTGTRPFSLSVVDTTSSSATLAIVPKFNGRIYYVVLDTGQAIPNAQQVLNGTDGMDNPAIIADTLPVNNAPDTVLLDIPGLNPSTDYRVCIVMQDQFGTPDIEVDTITFTTSENVVTNINNEPDVKIYPNPVRNFIRIQGLSQISKLEIFDFSGRKVMYLENLATGRVDVSDLKPGIYYAKITGENFSVVRKFIKF